MGIGAVVRIGVAAILVALGGCSGGGGEATPNPPPPPPPAAPTSGQFDATYGNNGKVSLPSSAGLDMVVAPDGSAYVVGNAALKLDAVGAPIASYGGSGQVDLDFAGGLASVAVDSLGNLFHTFRTGAPDFQSGVAKVDAAGLPVASFGVNGRFHLGPEGRGFFWNMVRDAEGNLYLTEFAASTHGAPILIAKVDREGRPATTFGDAGTGVVRLALPSRTFGDLLRVDAMGSVYLSVTSFDPVEQHLVVKLDRNGRLAGDFGAGGMWVNETCRTFATRAMELDGAGNLFLAGQCIIGTAATEALFKLDSRGHVVPSFRESGLRPAIFGSGFAREAIVALLLGEGGEIYVGGTRFIPDSFCQEPVLVKLDAQGNIVPGFGTGGFVTFASGPGHGGIRDLGRDSAGRIYAGITKMPGCAFPPGVQLTLDVYRLAP